MLSLFQSPKVIELEQRCEMLTRVTSLLLEGIRLHSVQSQEEGYFNFRDAIQHHQQDLEVAGTDRMLVAAGAILQSMSDYARQATSFYSNERQALHGIIAMLTQAVASSVDGRDRSITSLQTIIAKVEDAHGAHDLDSVKGQLEVCLHSLREQKEHHADEQNRLRGVISEVSTTLSAAGRAGGPAIDPVTGLRNRAAAEEALAGAFADKKSRCAILLRLETLVAINSRYSREFADEYFQKVSHLVAQQLGSLDLMFRWGGTVLIVLVDASQPLEAVHKKLRKLLSVASSKPLAVGGRAALLQVTLSSLCLETGKFPDIEAFIAHIDLFVYKTPEP